MSYSFTTIINNKDGVHARSAAMLLNIVKKYNVEAYLVYKDSKVNLMHLMEIIALSISYGSEITVIVDGNQEDICGKEIKNVIDNNFEVISW